jgi:hypothetical protein
MRTSEVLIMILLGAGLFMATLTVLYVVKVALTLLQGYLDRDPEPGESFTPNTETVAAMKEADAGGLRRFANADDMLNTLNAEAKSPDDPPF